MSPLDQLPVERHLDVTICGCGVVTPKIRSPLHSYDDPGHALASRAAVSIYSRFIVALADAGIPRVSLDADLTAVTAVPQQAFLQDVMTNGCSQVLSGGFHFDTDAGRCLSLQTHLHLFHAEALQAGLALLDAVTPQARSPLHSYDDPGHALAGRATVSIYSRVIVALADAGIPPVGMDADLTALTAVPQQAFLQDIGVATQDAGFVLAFPQIHVEHKGPLTLHFGDVEAFPSQSGTWSKFCLHTLFGCPSSTGSVLVGIPENLTVEWRRCRGLEAAREDSAFQGIQPGRNNGGSELGETEAGETERNLHGTGRWCLESAASDITSLIPARRTSVAACRSC
ncbi:hypothetical protein INR49_030473 [Caranx melampygus]|nr:hypothetical protein INR49_030473 [Caranx melampygus]